MTYEEVFTIETPSKAIVLRDASSSSRFFVVPLMPEIARDGDKPALQLMVINGTDGNVVKGFLSATITLPVSPALGEAIRAKILAQDKDIQNAQDIRLVPADIKNFEVTLTLNAAHGIEMQGRYEGVGTPRVQLNQSLEADQVSFLKGIWKQGLPDASISCVIEPMINAESLSVRVKAAQGQFKTQSTLAEYAHHAINVSQSKPQSDHAFHMQRALGVTKSDLLKTLMDVSPSKNRHE